MTAVPGVARLAPGHGLSMPQVRGAFAQPVRIEDSDEPPGRHVQIPLASPATVASSTSHSPSVRLGSQWRSTMLPAP
ncbi:hypothetical protein [Streptomyces sp. V1I1]|uniref:hypothetical protein n=1 Tax=Streptomyces sp. V1I1 TaxID=3042272 RepID=UPI00278129BF|nr:hypothetical protein [Streptomyces sp. V1I1]MDQ0941954.1 hypothetical protein [Streptomyces sp. V1I1]